MENKILTKEEMQIIELFRKDLLKRYTIREIMREINKKSYSWVFNSVKKLEKLSIITIEKKGHSAICSLNINGLSLTYLSLSEQERITKKLPLKNINKLLEVIPAAYFTFLITGSYASGKETSKSDLDVVAIVENREDTKKIYPIIKNKGELMVPKAHVYVFSKKEFLQMLLDKEENYGKEIYRSKIIIFGAENYYLIIKEAIENGFKG